MTKRNTEVAAELVDVVEPIVPPAAKKPPLMATKESFKKFKEFSSRKDILEVILEKGKLYSIDDVRRMIGEFLQRKVK